MRCRAISVKKAVMQRGQPKNQRDHGAGGKARAQVKDSRVCAPGIGVCHFFRGTLWDGLAAGIVAVLMYFWDYFFSAHNRNRVVYSLFMSVAAGILCSLAVVVGIGQNVDKVMIGSIMLSIPGINLMNSLRDMMCGDIITGILRLAEALMIAVAIAAGFGIAIMIFGGMLR